MSNYYIKSNNVNIYPASNRKTTFDQYARLNIEKNIVSIPKNIVDYESYTLIEEPVIQDSGEIIIKSGDYVISNYNIYIKADIHTGTTISNNTYIYFKLNLKTSPIIELDGVDTSDNSNSDYTALEYIISNSELSSNATQKYLLLAQVDGSGNIITKSNYKMSVNKSAIIPNGNWGLCDSSGAAVAEQRFGDWLANYFYIDDGEI